jgi:hypothetical protein
MQAQTTTRSKKLPLVQFFVTAAALVAAVPMMRHAIVPPVNAAVAVPTRAVDARLLDDGVDWSRVTVAAIDSGATVGAYEY